MRFSVDSNVLVYAFDRADARKHEIAVRLLACSAKLDCVLPAQAVGEFLNVIRRKHRAYFEEARKQAALWMDIFAIVPTAANDILKGAEMAAIHGLQLWDAIIWQVVRSAHASLFLTEDLQDGLHLDGMGVLNPFNPSNGQQLAVLLAGSAE